MDYFQDRSEKKRLVRDKLKKLSPYISKSESSQLQQIKEYEEKIRDLQEQVRFLDGESKELMSSLERALAEFETLKRKYYRSTDQLQQGRKQNEKLVQALNKAKEQIEELRREVEKLCAPPNSYAVFKCLNKDGTVDVLVDGKKIKVNIHPTIDPEGLTEGQQLILNEAYNVVDCADFTTEGEVSQIKDFLEGDRVIVLGRADEERVVHLSGRLREMELKIGDILLIDTPSGYAFERLPKSKVEEVVLEEIPDVTYDDIGGLEEQIEILKDGIELPYLYPDEFEEHRLLPPKGILLYGPPGCGKTMIAKAVANSLANKIEANTREKAKSYFLNIKGPELLNKYVGETEHKIREVFKKAKERADQNTPVIVFFDEIDSLFRVRGSGISSDMEVTVVAQFLSEIDGLEALKNVIVIGASNRQDLIDPAVLRPGRLDLKIKIDRPDKEGAKDIFSKYMVPEVPIHEEVLTKFDGDRVAAMEYLVQQATDYMYSTADENKFLEVTYARGDKEIFYFKDFASGAMIQNIVTRAKKNALKRYINGGEKGIKCSDLEAAVKEEFKENEDLPNTTNPDDWARIAGRKGERIVNIRTLMSDAEPMAKNIETFTPGQYL
jgi:proteasome-associated ATPase